MVPEKAGPAVQAHAFRGLPLVAEAGEQAEARWAEFRKNADALIHAHDELRMLIQPRQENV